MEFAALPRSDWSVFGQLNKSVESIDKKCFQIIEMIKSAFEQSSFTGSSACSITITNGVHEIALINSPVGRGRILRRWSSVGSDLHGTLMFQREQFDKYDRRYWETVWGLTVPKYESAYSGTGTNALRFDLDGFSHDPKHVAFVAAMSILAGMVNGPELSTAV